LFLLLLLPRTRSNSWDLRNPFNDRTLTGLVASPKNCYWRLRNENINLKFPTLPSLIRP
jgi:hypothetical protein